MMGKKKVEKLHLIDVLDSWRESEGFSEDDDVPPEFTMAFLKDFGVAFGNFIEAFVGPNYRDNVMAQFVADMHEGRADWKTYIEEGEE